MCIENKGPGNQIESKYTYKDASHTRHPLDLGLGDQETRRGFHSMNAVPLIDITGGRHEKILKRFRNPVLVAFSPVRPRETLLKLLTAADLAVLETLGAKTCRPEFWHTEKFVQKMLASQNVRVFTDVKGSDQGPCQDLPKWAKNWKHVLYWAESPELVQFLGGKLDSVATYINEAKVDLSWRSLNASSEVMQSFTSSCSFTEIISKLPGQRIIPKSIAKLRHVTDLDISHSVLSKSIPAEIGQLRHLVVLNLGYNNLTGTIPVQLADLTLLESLYLSCNKLTGSLPKELGRLRRLKKLAVSTNMLTGEIPLCLATDLVNLEKLLLVSNYFEPVHEFTRAMKNHLPECYFKV